MKVNKIYTLVALFLFLLNPFTLAHAEAFTVENIQFEGLQHLEESTVLSYLPIQIGQTVDEQDTADILKTLYQTGFFDDVNLKQNGNTLIVQVKERPVIEEVTFTGNKQITEKKLKPVLAKMGVAQGEIYDPSKVNMIRQALIAQYRELGYYSVSVDSNIVTLPRNRVKLNIIIKEGDVAKIEKITFVGNHDFSSRQLHKQMSMKEAGLLTWIGHKDRYSQDKLDLDLRNLSYFYYDHGYLEFKILSHTVKMSPDHKHVDITIFIKEGPVYKVSGVRVEGVNDPAVNQLIELKSGDIFSRKKVIESDQKITAYYANHGRALAKVQVTPQEDPTHQQVFLVFSVSPGPIVYVRHIHLAGNNFTSDTILRSSLLQMEAAPYSQRNIDESKRRLANLPYLKDVYVETHQVPNVPDQVDLSYHVTEVNAGKIMAQLGYSDTDGFLYGAGASEPNFLGTGKAVDLNFQNSQYQQTYNFSYTNPYYTTSGISRSINLFYTVTTPNQDLNQESYHATKIGGSTIYGFPITRHDRINAGGGYSYIKVSDVDEETSPSIAQFLDDHPSPYNQFNGYLSWLHDTLDRAIFPTRGYYQSLGADLGVPVVDSSLSYYKITFNNRFYYPLGYGFVINPHSQIGYGNGYGDLSGEYPFFENFYAGGINSIPGFQPNSLGPHNPGQDDEALGGNLLTIAGVNFIFPNFISERLRTSLTLTSGNVYDTNKLASDQIDYEDFDLSNMRSSVGLLVEWYSPLGPLEVTIAQAINKKSGDQTQIFGFSLGANI